MLISKDDFIHFVNRYKNCRVEQDAFHEALRPYFDSPFCKYLDKAVLGLEDLLVIVAECQQEDDIFNWWYSEVDEDDHIITVKDRDKGTETEYDVLTPEGLYNYLYEMYDKSLKESEEVVHGRWLPQKLLGEGVWDCSECKTLGSPQWKFCPVCGAKMDGGNENGPA